jgi:hypothetical protein
MKRAQFIRKSFFVIIAASVLSIAVFLAFQSKSEKILLNAASLRYPETDTELSEGQILNHLYDSKLTPLSDAEKPVAEPSLPDGQLEPPDSISLGMGESKFLLNSRWATIRYLGDNPAGAGVSGKSLNDAQASALGHRNDTIPVVTMAETINEMMDNYFAPLLLSLPRGQEILSRIKVQGSYFSPEYTLTHSQLTERDNAYVVGLQSLYVYPNSCFDRTESTTCNPKAFSAGHDPSIIAHELGHVIFNHLRDGQSLEGWQWFAVNEGYADFFSAAHSGNPVLGRIWRASRTSGTKYLRRLMDSPTLNDPSVADEGHTFSLVWSSALWKARRRIENEFKTNPREFDRVILLSINFLGESTKTRLGDAAAAVLKAADVLGQSRWKDTLRVEFEAAEIDLARGTTLKPAEGMPLKKSIGMAQCGVISSQKKVGNSPLALLLMLIPAFIAFLGRLKKIKFFHSLTILLGFVNSGCMLFTDQNPQNNEIQSKSILYQCDLRALKDGTPVQQSQRKLSFLFDSSKSGPQSSTTEQIFVGDERYENAESSLLLIVDKEKMRIDQIRRRDGQLFQMNLNQKYVSLEEALAVQNARLSAIVIEGAGRAILNLNKSASISPESPFTSAVKFDYSGLNLTAVSEEKLVGPNGFSPIAKEIYIDGLLLCQLSSMVK